MKQTFTTGELAKMCNVSIRTVQYYDKEGIVKPSSLSDGGRRLYTQKELKELRLVCLYKALGLSIDEIRSIMKGKDDYSMLSELLSKQLSNIDEGIENLQRTREKLRAVLQQIDESGEVKIHNLDEMDSLLRKKRNHRKTDIITYVFMACYILLLIAGFPAAAAAGGFAPYVMISIAVILLLSLIYYHQQVNAYICPSCHTKFTIGFFKDMLSLNGWKKGKYLKCPQCGRRGWCKETFPG